MLLTVAYETIPGLHLSFALPTLPGLPFRPPGRMKMKTLPSLSQHWIGLRRHVVHICT